MALIEAEQGTLNLLYNTALTLQMAADEDLYAAKAKHRFELIRLLRDNEAHYRHGVCTVGCCAACDACRNAEETLRKL